MFALLMKYEIHALWRALRKLLMITSLIMLSSLIILLLSIPLLGSLATLLFVLGGLGQLFGAMAILVYRYYRSLYSVEAYLTQTLPVKSSHLFWSKFIMAMLVQLLALLLFGLELYIAGGLSFARSFSQGGIPASVAFQIMNEQIGNLLHSALFLFILGISFVSLFFNTAKVAMCITKGNEAAMHRFGDTAPAIVFAVSYIAEQVLMVLAMLFLPIGVRFDMTETVPQIKVLWEAMWPSMLELIKNGSQNKSMITLGMGSLPLTLLLGTLYLLLTLRSMKYKTSLR